MNKSNFTEQHLEIAINHRREELGEYIRDYSEIFHGSTVTSQLNIGFDTVKEQRNEAQELLKYNMKTIDNVFKN